MTLVRTQLTNADRKMEKNTPQNSAEHTLLEDAIIEGKQQTASAKHCLNTKVCDSIWPHIISTCSRTLQVRFALSCYRPNDVTGKTNVTCIFVTVFKV
jgi:hypothetical protein